MQQTLNRERHFFPALCNAVWKWFQSCEHAWFRLSGFLEQIQIWIKQQVFLFIHPASQNTGELFTLYAVYWVHKL